MLHIVLLIVLFISKILDLLLAAILTNKLRRRIGWKFAYGVFPVVILMNLLLRFIGWRYGITLLLAAILGTIILLIVMIISIPLRYRISGSGDGEFSTVKAELKASWFFRLISMHATFQEKKFCWNARIFRKKMGSDVKEDDRDLVRRGEEKSSQKVSDHLEASKNLKESKAREGSEEGMRSTGEHDVSSDLDGEASSENETLNEHETSSENEASREYDFEQPQKKKGLIEKIKELFQKIKYTFEKICDIIKSLIEKKDKLAHLIQDEVHQKALKKLWKEIKKVLRVIKPKKFQVNFRFGFEDPSTTGQILIGLSILYPWFEDSINITPEFEQQVLQGDLLIKGHVRFSHFLLLAWRLFWFWIWNKDIREAYKNIKAFEL